MVARTRDEWLKLKTLAVSSTESPALFGMSPYLTAYELGVLKQRGDPDPHNESVRMQWGRRLQDAIAQGIADDYRVQIEGCENEFQSHPEESRMGASFDYRVVGTSTLPESSPLVALYKAHGPGLLEIKNVDWLEYKKWPENEMPDHIEIQVQHQLEVSRLEWAVAGVLVGGNRTEVYTRLRDEAVGGVIVSHVRKFWQDLDKGVLPPPLMPQDAEILIKMHQYAEPNKVLNLQEDATFKDLCDEYVNAGEVAREASKAQQAMKAEILQRIGDAERVLVEGFSLSAAMVASAEVKAYTRNAYRNLRLLRTKHGKE